MVCIMIQRPYPNIISPHKVQSVRIFGPFFRILPSQIIKSSRPPTKRGPTRNRFLTVFFRQSLILNCPGFGGAPFASSFLSLEEATAIEGMRMKNIPIPTELICDDMLFTAIYMLKVNMKAINPQMNALRIFNFLLAPVTLPVFSAIPIQVIDKPRIAWHMAITVTGRAYNPMSNCLPFSPRG